MSARNRPAVASDDWMLEQQVRAELEAEAWRRLRQEIYPPALPPPMPAPAAPAARERRQSLNYHRLGSAVFKGLARFGLAACAAYFAYLVAWESQLGAFEAWLAMGGAFAATLALSMLGPARALVQLLAETLRWALVGGLALGTAWLLVQMAG